jgi:polar amino acid transport system substrate-binding protein
VFSIVLVLFFISCNKHQKQKTIIFGISAQYPPLTYMENNEIKGFDIDLARLIGNKLGAQIEFKDMQFQSIFPAVSTKRIDAGTGCISITDERKKNFDFSVPYRHENIALIFRTEDKFRSTNDIRNNKIGAQLGNTIAVWAKKQFDNKNIKEMDSMPQLIETLKNKYIDGVFTSASHAVEFSKQNVGLSSISVAKSSEGCGILFKKDSDLVESVDKVLKEMIKNNEISDLERKWGLEE